MDSWTTGLAWLRGSTPAWRHRWRDPSMFGGWFKLTADVWRSCPVSIARLGFTSERLCWALPHYVGSLHRFGCAGIHGMVAERNDLKMGWPKVVLQDREIFMTFLVRWHSTLCVRVSSTSSLVQMWSTNECWYRYLKQPATDCFIKNHQHPLARITRSASIGLTVSGCQVAPGIFRRFWNIAWSRFQPLRTDG